MGLYNILDKINKIVEWDPSDLFYNVTYKYIKYKEPVWFLGCKDNGYDQSSYEYTNIGQWFEDSPTIISIIKIPYYFITWPILICLKIIWPIIGLFFPKKYSRCF